MGAREADLNGPAPAPGAFLERRTGALLAEERVKVAELRTALVHARGDADEAQRELAAQNVTLRAYEALLAPVYPDSSKLRADVWRNGPGIRSRALIPDMDRVRTVVVEALSEPEYRRAG